MRAKGSLLLRFAALCAVGAITGGAAHAQFLESPETNLFGSDFVKTFDVRAGGMVIENDRRGIKPAKLEGYEALLLFRDGRQLRGRLISVGKDEIIWKRPDLGEPLHLRPSDVHRVYLAPDSANGFGSFMPNAIRFVPGGRIAGRRGAGSGAAQTTVKLKSNDWLRGSVTSPDGQSFALRLDNNGSSITMPRSQVEWLSFDSNTMYGGGFDGSLADAEDWLASAPSATISDDGSLVISGPNEWFGRFLPQPALFEISMEIPADSENGSHLWLQPAAPMPNTFSVGAVDIGLDAKQLTLQRFANPMEKKTAPIAGAGGPNAKGIVRYHILYDSDKHRLAVFRNGELVVDWKPDESNPGDPARNSLRPEILTYLTRLSFPRIAMGVSLGASVKALQPPVDGLGSIPELLAAAFNFQLGAQIFASELRARIPRINGISLTGAPATGNQSGPTLKLHRFRVMPWDGNLPREGEGPAAADRLSSASLGSMSGKLEAITEKEVIFAGKSDPKQAGTLIRLPHESSAPFDTVARVSFGAAGELRAASVEFRDGMAHLHTALADDLELPATALTAITIPALDPRSPMMGESVVFKNGDELPGALVSASHSAPLRWKLSSGEEVAIQHKNVAGIRFAAPVGSTTGAESAYAELRNGDRLRGRIVSFDEHRLGLKEPLLGPLSVDRSHIWRLFPQNGADIRNGTDDPAGWISTELKAAPFSYGPRRRPPDPKLAWLYFDGCFLRKPTRIPNNPNGQMEVLFLSSPAPRQQDGLFEFRAEITAASGNMMNAMMTIAGKQNENGAASAISINFSGTEMFVNVMNATRGSNARQIALGEKLGKLSSRLSFRVFVNSVLGTADIMINGTLAARIGQQANERAPGIDQAVQLGGLSFDGRPLIFSNLWIGPWDGELPRAETAGRASTTLANGDVTASIPAALTDGKYLMETEVGQIRLPAASLSAIAFGGESAQTHSAARLRLADGSVVHVASFEIRDRALRARSELLGDIHLPLESIAEIALNPEPLREPPGAAPRKPAQAAAANSPPVPAKPFVVQ